MIFHLMGQFEHGLVAAMKERIDNRKGELSLSHIVAGGFAYLLFIIVIIEDIITNLEDNTHLTAEELSTLHLNVGGPCRQSANG